MDEEKVNALVASALAEFAAKSDEKWTAKFAELSDAIGKGGASAALGDATDKISDAIIKLGARIEKAEQGIAEASGKLLKSEAENIQLKEEVATYGDALRAVKIVEKINEGLANGTLEAKDAPGFGADDFSPIKWLSESKFNGIKGLSLHVATSSPVVSLADRRRSAPTGKPERHADDDVQLSEDQLKRAGFASMDEFNKFASMGPAGDSRRAAR